MLMRYFHPFVSKGNKNEKFRTIKLVFSMTIKSLSFSLEIENWWCFFGKSKYLFGDT